MMKDKISARKNTSNSVSSPLQRKRKQRCLLLLAEFVWLIFFLILRSHLSSLLAFIIPAIISGFLCLYANKKLRCPELESPDRIVFSVIIPFGSGMVLDMVITIVTMYKLYTDKVVQDVDVMMFLCQVLFFVLFVALIWVHNRPDQLQYIVYAIAYFIVVILEWANTANLNLLSFMDLDLDFSIPYFILPFKEAMLLYIILDVALQAFLKKYEVGNMKSETCILAQKQNTSKEHSVRRKPNTQKRGKRKK